MTVSFALIAERLQNSPAPEATRDLIMQLGYSGLVFQRWHRDEIENWEGKLPAGFLEHYYGTKLDLHCPIARAVHSWTRSFTFTEARAVLRRAVDQDMARKVEHLFQSFGIEDGVVLFTGSHTQRSSVILTCSKPCTEQFDDFCGLLHLAAHRLTQQLPTGHKLLSRVPREHPNLSTLQTRILEMQIQKPELSSSEMAQALGMSPKTLHAHHKKIAKKTGVTTFAGAVLRHLHQKR